MKTIKTLLKALAVMGCCGLVAAAAVGTVVLAQREVPSVRLPADERPITEDDKWTLAKTVTVLMDAKVALGQRSGTQATTLCERFQESADELEAMHDRWGSEYSKTYVLMTRISTGHEFMISPEQPGYTLTDKVEAAQKINAAAGFLRCVVREVKMGPQVEAAYVQ